MTSWQEDYLALNKLESISKYFIIALIIYIFTSLTWKYGLQIGISLWFINGFNIIFWGIIKYIVTDKWKVFTK